MTALIRNYTNLSKIDTYLGRYEYLRLGQAVGDETFGYDRYLNQMFYRSKEWQAIRNFVIVRDKGCDLGLDGYEIYGRIIIHHMNPITPQDIVRREPFVLDPEYLVCVGHYTHEAITYGDESLLPLPLQVRTPNDTTPWRSH